jgi:hypothetical protein
MPPTQPRHDDIIIRRRFGEHPSTRTVKQIYAVTYPGHTDQGAERDNYGEAEKAALTLAQEQGRSVWYEENPSSGKRTLVKSFGDADDALLAVKHTTIDQQKPQPQEPIDKRIGEPAK